MAELELTKCDAMALEARLDVDELRARFPINSSTPLHVLVALLFEASVSERDFEEQCTIFTATFGVRSMWRQLLTLKPEDRKAIQRGVLTCHTYHLHTTPGHVPLNKYHHWAQWCRALEGLGTSLNGRMPCKASSTLLT